MYEIDLISHAAVAEGEVIGRSLTSVALLADNFPSMTVPFWDTSKSSLFALWRLPGLQLRLSEPRIDGYDQEEQQRQQQLWTIRGRAWNWKIVPYV